MWEVLEGGLKSKIEIQWSDITSLKASCSENESGTLEVVVILSFVNTWYLSLSACSSFS